MSTEVRLYNVGEEVIVTSKINGHKFKVDEYVTIKKINSHGFICENEAGATWALTDAEITKMY